MRLHKTEAIILKRVNRGEQDKLITIFSKTIGKMKVVACGIRKITSRRAPHLELFNRVNLTLYKGQSLDIVTYVSPVDSYRGIKNDLERIALGYIIVELVDRLCAEHQPHSGVYQLLVSALTNLDQQKHGQNLAESVSKELLSELGFIAKLQQQQHFDSFAFIEHLIERRIRSREFLQSLTKHVSYER